MVDKCVEFTEDSKIEFHKAQCFMEFKGKKDELWEDIDRQNNIMLEFALASQIRYKNVRIIPLERFNYSIQYTVKPYGVLFIGF